MNILEVLKKGEENAIHVQELADIFGTNITTIKKEIRRLRLEGILICSNTKGYFMPATRAEIEQYYKTWRKFALTCIRSLKAARKALNEIGGQISLEEK